MSTTDNIPNTNPLRVTNAVRALQNFPEWDREAEITRILKKFATSLDTAVKGQYVLQLGRSVQIHGVGPDWVSLGGAFGPDPRFLKRNGASVETPRNRKEALTVATRQDIEALVDKTRRLDIAEALEELTSALADKLTTAADLNEVVAAFKASK